nr:MAG TPA: hypothetical protein [Caudoviricetes sp.]
MFSFFTLAISSVYKFPFFCKGSENILNKRLLCLCMWLYISVRNCFH